MKKICIKTIVLIVTIILSNSIEEIGGTPTSPIKQGGGPFLSY